MPATKVKKVSAKDIYFNAPDDEGSVCKFFKTSKSRGFKQYNSMCQALSNYVVQLAMYYKGIMPRAYEFVANNNLGIFGFTTQLVEIYDLDFYANNPEYKHYCDEYCADFDDEFRYHVEYCGLEVCDLHCANVGFVYCKKEKKNKFVIVDCSHFQYNGDFIYCSKNLDNVKCLITQLDIYDKLPKNVIKLIYGS